MEPINEKVKKHATVNNVLLVIIAGLLAINGWFVHQSYLETKDQGKSQTHFQFQVKDTLNKIRVTQMHKDDWLHFTLVPKVNANDARSKKNEGDIRKLNKDYEHIKSIIK